MNTESSIRRFWLGLLVFGLFCVPLRAQNAQDGKIDYNQVRIPIQNFEKLISDIIKATLPGDFGVVQKPKGAFVVDSGYNFMFLVNVNRGLIHSPMGTFVDPSALTPAMKKKKLDTLKELLVNLLYSHGSAMPQLRKDRSITIIALFEEFTPEEGAVNTTWILSVLKSDLDESLNKQLGFNEFKNRVKIVEY